MFATPLTHNLAGRALAVIAALVTATTLMPREVYPCGGCFTPPGQQSGSLIVQNAERVFFYKDPVNKKSVAWVEVRYSGPGKDFGWVLPLPVQPKVSVGTSWVFDQMDQRFSPRFQTTPSPKDENCRSWSAYCYGDGIAVSSTSFGSSSGGGSADSGANAGPQSSEKGNEPPVKILDQDAAGPYNYVVLASSDSKALLKWLNDNGYNTPKKALPIIESHLKKGDVFVGVKLQSGAGANMIRPIVLEMEGAEACVPLRLTSIAASDDMSVVTTIAGPGRAIPKNMMHVKVNPMKLNWFSGGNNYQSVLSEAIDEAAGHAFVTEFSGDAKAGVMAQVETMSSSHFEKVSNALELARAIWDSKIPMTADAANTLELATGLAKTNNKTAVQYFQQLRNCGHNNAYKYPQSYCNKVFGERYLLPVDGKKVAKLMDKDYIQPIQRLNNAVKASKKITRMVMRISPEEMDRDPIFSFNPDLPDVKNEFKATLHRVCSTGWYPYDSTRLVIEGVGSWVFKGQMPGQQGSSKVANNATDPRFVTAPMAANIEYMEESGAANQVHSAQVDLVDGIIAGSKIGKPTVPGEYELKKAGKRWTPPANDKTVTHVDSRNDKECPRYHPIKPWEINGTTTAAAVVPHDPGMSSLDGGCTAGSFGSTMPLSSGLVAAFAFLILFVRRRLYAAQR